MVCLGNICRSPLAQGILEKKVKENNLDWVVDSAGTSGYHNGEQPHHLSIKIAKENGIDISQQISRKFLKEDIDRFDKVFVMDSDNYIEVQKICGSKFNFNKVDLILNQTYPNQNKSVPDPWYGKEENYLQVFEMLTEACGIFISKFV